MARCDVPEGHEIRGFMIRLYPTAEQKEALKIIEDDTRRCWNWLVKQTEETLQARAAYALREGLVGPRPERPCYDGMAPELAQSTKDAHIEACREWHKRVYEATNNVPECGFRSIKEILTHFGCKHDYQLLKRVVSWGYEEGVDPEIAPGAHLLQSVFKNYFTKSKRRKRFRRSSDPMPLQVRSGDCFEVGDFGTRRGKPFYDCQVKINGLKIKGRLPGKKPVGRVLEGVSLRLKADGWWASIKEVLPKRVLSAPTPGSRVGIDTGLDYIAVISEGRKIENPNGTLYEEMGPVLKGHESPRRISNSRGKEYAERIAGRQARKLPVGRLQLAASRHVKHVLYNEVVKPLQDIEEINVEKLTSRVGQMGSSKTSAMRTAVHMLQERYGNRVREVMPHHTSQECSQCGFRSKESWSYEHGRMGECPKCGYRQDRDVNASRNIAAKAPISKGS